MNSISIFTDPVVTCPYNKLHRIALSKIRTHIVKCEKNFPVGYKETCPFNATHRLFKHELKDHITNCPQNRPLEHEALRSIENHGSQMSDFIAQSIAECTLDHGESWEEESQENSKSSNDGNLNNYETCFNLNRFDNPQINLRRPYGYSEAMMMGGESDVAISDMESVVSVMGIGRGRMSPKNIQLFKSLKFGRGGRCMPDSY